MYKKLIDMILKSDKKTIVITDDEFDLIIDSLQLMMDFDDELRNQEKRARKIDNLLMTLYEL